MEILFYRHCPDNWVKNIKNSIYYQNEWNYHLLHCLQFRIIELLKKYQTVGVLVNVISYDESIAPQILYKEGRQ